MSDARLAVGRLRHAFDGAPVLRDVDLAVAPGEIVSLVGPSGCGKSTLLRLVAGLERAQAGTIEIDGRRVAGPGLHVPPERRGVGMVFQDFALFPHLSVLDNVAFGAAGRTARDCRRAALSLIARVGLAERAEVPPHVLSGGQQQRVAVARALAMRPRLMLLDEPFSNLDVGLRGRMRAETRSLLEESGAAAILVTHDPEEAMFMADRIALMADGRIVQAGTPAELYRRPADAFVAAFFGEVNRTAAVVAGGGIATPFGRIAAPGLAEGAPAELLIRCEALKPAPAGAPDGVSARVARVRPLGACAAVELLVDGACGPPLALSARLPAGAASEGETIRIRLDPAGAFVFRRRD